MVGVVGDGLLSFFTEFLFDFVFGDKFEFILIGFLEKFDIVAEVGTLKVYLEENGNENA